MEENWGIIGHQKIVQFLQKSIERNRLAHTYLFYGQKSLGKTTLAERFAEKLLGSKEALTTDLYKVEMEEGKKDIAIEQVREWRRLLQLKPFHQGYKVGIIYEAEKLNLQSANALLKTIEEPTPKTVIILITSGWDKILPTIISRSQLIRFSPLTKQEICQGLLTKGYLLEEVNNIVDIAGGYPGQAIIFLENQQLFKKYQELQHQVLKILDYNMAERFLIIERLLSTTDEFNKKVNLALDFLKHIKKLFRNLLLQSYNLAIFRQNQKLTTTRKYSTSKVLECLTKIYEAEQQLRSNIQPRLVLENLFLYL